LNKGSPDRRHWYALQYSPSISACTPQVKQKKLFHMAPNTKSLESKIPVCLTVQSQSSQRDYFTEPRIPWQVVPMFPLRCTRMATQQLQHSCARVSLSCTLLLV
jgi:hypothetical protein